MNVSIFIVSCVKHFTWLQYCLKSIDKFARGFRRVIVIVPEDDFAGLQGMVNERSMAFRACAYPIGLQEWPGKGMLWHMWQIMQADCVVEEICKAENQA